LPNPAETSLKIRDGNHKKNVNFNKNNSMKKIIEFIVIAAVLCCLSSCEVHELWGDGLPELEHVYVLFLDQPESEADFLSYEIAQNGDARWRYGSSATSGTWMVSEQWVASIPFIFNSERVRSYDVVSFIWLESTLMAGTDYVVTREDGTVITPDANGGYPLIWPQAKKAVQSIKIKRIQGSPNGTVRVQTFNRAKGVPVSSDVTSLVNNKTAEYEVRCTAAEVNRVMVTFN
jgi:hypothetical protein